ncbi:MAG: acyl carrier protein [Bryobacteraceae bacterium]
MNREQFLRQFEELLEQPSGTLTGAEKLEEVEGWDSVALVSFLALADEHFGRRLAPRDVGKCETVDELYRLASQNSAAV